MPSVNRTNKLKSLQAALKKKHPQVPKVPERSVFLHLIYAACLENAPSEAADRAMVLLEEEFVDWNEVRVATAAEIADTLPHLPEPLAAGERIKRALQAVFDTYYDFTLDDLIKKPIAQVNQFFESHPTLSSFMAAYVMQVALGNHIIPIDEAAFRLLRLLDLTQVSPDNTRETVPALERAITKGDGIAFAMMLHNIAAQFYEEPESPALRLLLKPIDPASKTRMWDPPVLVQIKREPPRPARKETPSLDPSHIVAAFDDDGADESPHATGEIEFIPNELVAGDSSDAAKGVSAKAASKPKTPVALTIKTPAPPKPASKPKSPVALTIKTPATPKPAAAPKSPVALTIKTPATPKPAVAPKSPVAMTVKTPAPPKPAAAPKSPVAMTVKTPATPKPAAAPKSPVALTVKTPAPPKPAVAPKSPAPKTQTPAPAKPAAKPTPAPAHKPAAKPATKPVPKSPTAKPAKPATKPTVKPAAKPATKPVPKSPPAKRPPAKPAAKPPAKQNAKSPTAKLRHKKPR